MTITPQELLRESNERNLRQKVATAQQYREQSYTNLMKAMEELAAFLGKVVQGECIVDKSE